MFLERLKIFSFVARRVGRVGQTDHSRLMGLNTAAADAFGYDTRETN